MLIHLCMLLCRSITNSGPSCSKPDLANPGLMENLIVSYLITIKEGFFPRLRFRGKKFFNFVAIPLLTIDKGNICLQIEFLCVFSPLCTFYFFGGLGLGVALVRIITNTL